MKSPEEFSYPLMVMVDSTDKWPTWLKTLARRTRPLSLIVHLVAYIVALILWIFLYSGAVLYSAYDRMYR